MAKVTLDINNPYIKKGTFPGDTSVCPVCGSEQRWIAINRIGGGTFWFDAPLYDWYCKKCWDLREENYKKYKKIAKLKRQLLIAGFWLIGILILLITIYILWRTI